MTGRLRHRLEAFAARFGRAREGATAVEFAMVALPFFFMMFAIFELGHLFVLASTLETATMDAGRQVRTGQLQTSGGTAATFKSAICARMSVFQASCNANLTIDVRVMPQFAGQSPPDPTSGSTFQTGALGYQPGGPEDIVLVRAWWRQPLFTPLLNQGLSRQGDGNAVLTAAAAFRNEPYQ